MWINGDKRDWDAQYTLPGVDEDRPEHTLTVDAEIIAGIGRDGDVDHGVEEALER